jgi:hypothetical protein
MAPLLALLVVFGLPAMRTSAAATAGAPTMQLQQRYPHGYIETTAAPGETFASQIRVADGGAVPGDFLFTAVDAYTSSASGIVYGNRQTPLRDGPRGNGEYGAGDWISLSERSMHLSPGEGRLLSVSVTVPASTPPGDWVGAVTGENPEIVSVGSGGPGLAFTQAAEIAIVVHVPGQTSIGTLLLEKPSVTIEAAQEFLDVPLHYTGDVITKPLYSFTITDLSGKTMYSGSGRFDSFMAHTNSLYRVLLTPTLVEGTYRFSGRAGPDSNQQESQYTIVVDGHPVALSDAGGVASGGGFWSQRVALVFTGSIVLGLTGLVLLLILRRSHRCAHCGGRAARGFFAVSGSADVAGCDSSYRQALLGEATRLCQTCYRRHIQTFLHLSPHAP